MAKIRSAWMRNSAIHARQIKKKFSIICRYQKKIVSLHAISITLSINVQIMRRYYVLREPAWPEVEHETKLYTDLFDTIVALTTSMQDENVPEITDIRHVREFGISISERAHKIDELIPICMKTNGVTVFPRHQIGRWLVDMSEMFCHFMVEWISKLKLYIDDVDNNPSHKQKIPEPLTTAYKKLKRKRYRGNLSSYADILINDPDWGFILDTVDENMGEMEILIEGCQTRTTLDETYQNAEFEAVLAASAYIVHGAEQIMALMDKLDRIDYDILNKEADDKFYQMELISNTKANEWFYEILREFDEKACESHLPYISSEQWKQVYDKYRAELLLSAMGRKCAKELDEYLQDTHYNREEIVYSIGRNSKSMDEYVEWLRKIYVARSAYGAYTTALQREEDNGIPEISIGQEVHRGETGSVINYYVNYHVKEGGLVNDIHDNATVTTSK